MGEECGDGVNQRLAPAARRVGVVRLQIGQFELVGKVLMPDTTTATRDSLPTRSLAIDRASKGCPSTPVTLSSLRACFCLN
jgi:hypothetical protein